MQKLLKDKMAVENLFLEKRMCHAGAVVGGGRHHNHGALHGHQQHLRAGDALVTGLCELPVLGQMASAGMDKNVVIWDIVTGVCKRVLKGHSMGVRCIAFAEGPKVLLTVEDKIYYRIFSALKLNIIGYLIVNPS